MAHTPDLITPQDDWRLDFRLVEELPEDSIIGRRFIFNAMAGLFASAALLVCGWTGYGLYTVFSGINDWENRITEAESEVRRVEQLQAEYGTETANLEAIYRLMSNPIPLTLFLSELGATLPKPMVVDMIESKSNKIVIRGTLDEGSERASRLIGDYVIGLRSNEIIGPRFSDIKLSGLERFEEEQGLSFEITFTPKAEETEKK